MPACQETFLGILESHSIEPELGAEEYGYEELYACTEQPLKPAERPSAFPLAANYPLSPAVALGIQASKASVALRDQGQS